MGVEKGQPAIDSSRSSVLIELGALLDVGVLSTDTNLVIRGWNKWLEVATGSSEEDVIGRSLLSVFPDIAENRSEHAFRRAMGGETVMMAHRFHRWLLPLKPSPGFAEFDLCSRARGSHPSSARRGSRG